MYMKTEINGIYIIYPDYFGMFWASILIQVTNHRKASNSTVKI
jgi:hypothetical protein